MFEEKKSVCLLGENGNAKKGIESSKNESSNKEIDRLFGKKVLKNEEICSIIKEIT